MITRLMPCPEDLPLVVFEAFKGHALDRRGVGNFVTACLENNCGNAVCGADADNYLALRRIAQFMHCDLPSDCHGSREKVQAWLADKD